MNPVTTKDFKDAFGDKCYSCAGMLMVEVNGFAVDVGSLGNNTFTPTKQGLDLLQNLEAKPKAAKAPRKKAEKPADPTVPDPAPPEVDVDVDVDLE